MNANNSQKSSSATPALSKTSYLLTAYFNGKVFWFVCTFYGIYTEVKANSCITAAAAAVARTTTTAAIQATCWDSNTG